MSRSAVAPNEVGVLLDRFSAIRVVANTIRDNSGPGISQSGSTSVVVRRNDRRSDGP